MEKMTHHRAMEILGLTGRPDLTAAKQAYRSLALKYHPDNWATAGAVPRAAELRMREINRAWDYLSTHLPLSSPDIDPGDEGAGERNVPKSGPTLGPWLRNWVERVKRTRGAGARPAAPRGERKTKKARSPRRKSRFQDVLDPLCDQELGGGRHVGSRSPWENYSKHMAVKKQIKARKRARGQGGNGRVERVTPVRPVDPVSR